MVHEARRSVLAFFMVVPIVAVTFVATTAMPAGAVTAPDAPVIRSVIPYPEFVQIDWELPFDGGSPITSYTVTVSPGDLSLTFDAEELITFTCGFGPEITCARADITGLTKGTTYTLTVTATNDLGSSLPSEPSAPVTAGEILRIITPPVDATYGLDQVVIPRYEPYDASFIFKVELFYDDEFVHLREFDPFDEEAPPLDTSTAGTHAIRWDIYDTGLNVHQVSRTYCVETCDEPEVVADVGVSLDVSVAPVSAGLDLVYTATITNYGPDGTDVTFTQGVPSGSVFASAASSTGSCELMAATVSCDLGAMGPASTATIVVVASPTVVGPNAGGTTATVEGTATDPNAANDSATVTKSVQGRTCTIVGTQGDDTLVGSSANNVICGLGGSDALDGAIGDDRLVGGSGDDTLHGGWGSDVLFGGPENDMLSGDDGFDTAQYQYAAGPVVVDLGGAAPQVSGADGLDTIDASTEDVIGSLHDDTLIGGPDADTFLGIDGNDTIDGGPGDDTLEGGAGDDTLNGGPGVSDAIAHDSAPAGVTVTLYLEGPQDTTSQGVDTIVGAEALYGSPFADTLRTGITPEGAGPWLAGGAGSDQMFGDEAVDTMWGDDGVDVMSGGGEGDYLDGGVGWDQLDGGAGADSLHGGIGNDLISGSGEDDFVTGGPGADSLWAGSGHDTVYGDEDGDAIYGEDGDDSLLGGSGGDHLEGGVGLDSIYGDAGGDSISGQGDTDYLIGGSEGDSITGGLGGDILIGEEGDDVLAGDDGNDFLRGELGNDTLRGGTGTDYASYLCDCSSVGVTVDLRNSTSRQSTGQGSDLLSTIENVYGTLYIDTLTGSSGANALYGIDGNDTLRGSAGPDLLDGGRGDDSIDGGDGDDRIDTDLFEIQGNDTFVGGKGLDTVSYRWAPAAVVIDLGSSLRQQTGGGGADQYSTIENVEGSAYSDSILGSGSANIITAWEGQDVVRGGLGTDTLSGGPGHDDLFGDGSNDELDGGAGNDDLDGGAGSNDTCIQGQGSGLVVFCETLVA